MSNEDTKGGRLVALQVDELANHRDSHDVARVSVRRRSLPANHLKGLDDQRDDGVLGRFGPITAKARANVELCELQDSASKALKSPVRPCSKRELNGALDE